MIKSTNLQSYVNEQIPHTHTTINNVQ